MTHEVQLLTHEFRPFTGGIGVYVEEMALAAAGSGLATTVWAPDYNHPSVDSFPFTVQRIPMRGKQDWICRLRLAHALKRHYPDGRIPGTLVLAEPGPIRLWMYCAFLRLPVPDRLVIVLHGSEVRALASHPRRRKRLQSLLQASDKIGHVSGAVRESVSGLVPGKEDLMVPVPGAVRSNWSTLPPVDRRSIPEARKAILQVGRIHPRKGQLELVQALGELPPSLRDNLTLRLVGPSGNAAYLAQIKALAEEKGLPVYFEGNLSETELRAAYETATVTVMPSQPYRNSVEGLGLALLEAQHFGCPVIGTHIGGIPEAIKDGDTGLLVPPADSAALASAIRHLMEHPEEAAAMGLAGAGFVRETFSWAKNLQRLGLA